MQSLTNKIPKIAKILIIYHNKDLDGIVSAGLFYNILIDNPLVDIKLQGYDYGDSIPEKIFSYGMVFILDVSLPTDEMVKLYNHYGDKLIWIDHHKNKIQEIIKIVPIKGFYSLTNRMSACELSFNYLFPDLMVNTLIKNLSLYDTYQFKKLPKGEQLEVLYIQYALRNHIIKPEDYGVISKDYQEFLQEGKHIYHYLKIQAEKITKTQAYKRMIGDKELLFFNVPHFNPYNFDIEIKEDGIISYHYEKGKWYYSIRSPKFDCGVLARKFGGNGHPGAAGFKTERLI